MPATATATATAPSSTTQPPSTSSSTAVPRLYHVEPPETLTAAAGARTTTVPQYIDVYIRYDARPQCHAISCNAMLLMSPGISMINLLTHL